MAHRDMEYQGTSIGFLTEWNSDEVRMGLGDAWEEVAPSALPMSQFEVRDGKLRVREPRTDGIAFFTVIKEI